jgi:anti-sigma factor RsiW
MTEPTTEPLPPDPDAYDSPRAERARARGLSAPYIPGGTDPDPEPWRREERRYLWLLLAMVAFLAFGAFALGILASLLGLGDL